MTCTKVENGFQAHVSFPFGWSGMVGVVPQPDGTYQMAYRSMLAPPVGHEMLLGERLLVVRHVTPATTPNGLTVLTLVAKGYELKEQPHD